MNVKITDGTHSAWRRTSPQPEAWTCPKCDRENARWAGNCPDCYTRRP